MADLIDRDAAHDAIGFERCDRSCTDCPTKCTWFYTVKNIPAVNRWIPVEDALPDEFIYVICGGKDGMAILRYNGNVFVDDAGYAYSMSAITHWMPLPEPPEKE